jgi:ATP-dependent helicase/nuclease subunit B
MQHAYTELFAQLTEKSVVITVNRRLANHLLYAYQQWQIAQGNTTWHQPEFLPLSCWLEEYWQQSFDAGLLPPLQLISDPQVEIIWQNIIQRHANDTPLLQPRITAQQVIQAWSLIQQWGIALSTLRSDHPDHAAFHTWAQAYQAYCEQQQYIDKHALLPHLQHIASHHPCPWQNIFLLGFDDMPPQVKQLFNQLENLSCRVTFLTPKTTVENIQRIACNDWADEISLVAHWAKQRLDENPKQTIGIVVPQLEAQRDTIARIFTDVLAPQQALALTQDYDTLPFNISLGESLTTFPLIFAALQILNLNQKRIPVDTLSYILRSPFIAEAETQCAPYALLNAELHALQQSALPLQTIIQLAKKYSTTLAERLEHFLKLCTHKAHSISTWKKIFTQQLQCLGFPGERSLNSMEYQQLQRWQALLHEYQELCQFIAPQSFTSAYQYLLHLAQHSKFQAKSPPSSIQIIGVLESAGLLFDHLWVMGMDNQTWPASPQPNAFLPASLQHQQQMPHASAQRELAYAQQITQRLMQSSTQVIFSYHQLEADRELSASALISTLTEITSQQLVPKRTANLEQQVYQQCAQETFVDEFGPALRETEKVRGGSSIFKEQAACPFRAFSKLRLQANTLEQAQLGLSMIARGSNLHLALKIIWSQLKTQTALQQCGDAELSSLIQQAATQAIAPSLAQHSNTLNKRFQQLEIERLTKLLHAWLRLEKERAYFEVVATEQSFNPTFANLPIHLQVDRIDRLQNGDYVIIDYKTGKTNIANWFGERLAEPQLPLYCITGETDYTAIAFAEIRADSLQFKGIGDECCFAQGVISIAEQKYVAHVVEWQQLQQLWEQHLTQLAEQFAQGYAKVDPQDIHKDCRYCDLPMFCRIHEVTNNV